MKTVPVSMSARMLDLFYPEWWMFINTETLDINDCELCILGQLYDGVAGYWSGYDYFTDFYRRSIDWTVKYNFNIHFNDRDIDHLNALWLNEIYKRVNA